MPSPVDTMQKIAIALTSLSVPDNQELSDALDIARDTARDFIASASDPTVLALLDSQDADTLFRVLSRDLNIPHLGDQAYAAACAILEARDGSAHAEPVAAESAADEVARLRDQLADAERRASTEAS